jgi:hypothetical protein
MTVPALFAAALEPGIAAVYLAGGLASYRSLLEQEDYAHPFANFVPGILSYTDLPFVAAGLGGRPLRISGAVDGAGRTLPAAEVERIYAGTGATVEQDAAWDVDTLSRL